MIETFRDRMVTHDDLLITNDLSKQHSECAAPHGRLFEQLGVRPDGRRVVREIACNIVVVGGAITVLESLTGATASWKPSTLNEIHSVSATAVGLPKLALFGAGIGGSGLEFGSVVAPDIKQRDILQPVPIRYSEVLTGDDSAKYFMKVPNSGGTTNSWYLKEFQKTPTIKSCWKNGVSEDEDGTEIVSEIYDATNTEGIETFTEITINLNTLDIREYFEGTGKLSAAKYNTFGFYTGAKTADKGEYGDVRLYSAITFNNRDLTQKTSSTFIYRVYSLI